MTAAANSAHVLTQLEQRKSTNYFLPGRPIPDEHIRALVHYASQAPSSSNLQHWRFLALSEQARKEQLCSCAFQQRKILEASVAFVVLADLHAVEEMPRLTDRTIREGAFGEDMRDTWNSLAVHYRDPQINRDEALRSAALASMNLMTAAHALGYVSGAVGGFDSASVRATFQIPERYLISLIVVVGSEAPENWRKKPRKPVDEILFLNHLPRD